jgi:hypothetical protein
MTTGRINQVAILSFRAGPPAGGGNVAGKSARRRPGTSLRGWGPRARAAAAECQRQLRGVRRAHSIAPTEFSKGRSAAGSSRAAGASVRRDMRPSEGGYPSPAAPWGSNRMGPSPENLAERWPSASGPQTPSFASWPRGPAGLRSPATSAWQCHLGGLTCRAADGAGWAPPLVGSLARVNVACGYLGSGACW